MSSSGPVAAWEGGRAGEVVEAGGGGEALVGLDGDAAAVALEGVDPVVRFPGVARGHGADGGDPGGPGGQDQGRELGDVGAAARDARRLEVAAHGTQRRDEALAGQRLDPDAAVQR